MALPLPVRQRAAFEYKASKQHLVALPISHQTHLIAVGNMEHGALTRTRSARAGSLRRHQFRVQLLPRSLHHQALLVVALCMPPWCDTPFSTSRDALTPWFHGQATAPAPRPGLLCGEAGWVASRPPRQGKVERSARKPGNQRVFSRSASRGHWLCSPWVYASQSR